MKIHHVDVVTPADQATVFSVLTLAFSGDPMARWSWSESRVYLETFPSFAKAFGGLAFEKGTAHLVGAVGAALWLPPGVHPDEDELGRIVGATMPAALMEDGAKVMQEMAGYHPKEPHWYLPLIGVDPAHQGKGIGGALLKYALATCDRDGALAYLESSNPSNIALYERHGFVGLGVIQHGKSPRMVPMLRKPRSRK